LPDARAVDARGPDAGSGDAASADGGASDAGTSAAACSLADCTVYVATNGSDTNRGTMESPFATVQHAADVAQPGDVICARGGTYTGVALARSGAPSQPIVLRTYPGETAALSAGLAFFAGWGQPVGWILVQGFDITQPPATPSDSGQCVYFHSAHDVVLRQNVVHDCYGQGLLGDAHNVVIDGNRIARSGLSFVNDSMRSNLYHGIYMTGTNITITNNIIEGNAAYGVQVAGYPWDPTDPNHPAGPEYSGASGWAIVNNTIVRNLNRAGIVVWQPDARDNLIENNIFFQNDELGPGSGGTNGIDFYHCGAGNRVSNNLYFGSGPPVSDTEGGASYVEANPYLSDPQFVDVARSDFHLQPGSPAIDHGEAAGAPDHDAECNPRPRGGAVDIGAYERAAP
ncbi:MAG TPA: right-handed parallel beta-helix repeat-containing protein, partial [Polyangia bacterium]|nr:right-handed parallel beta-helix repeat-containing protein [Polyangia bacterium]